jgi:hypothetical protein
MATSFHNLSITDEDRSRFPDLFASKKQLVFNLKIDAGKAVRSNLKNLKRNLIQEKIRKEKTMIKERTEFEGLLDKYSKFKNAKEEMSPYLSRQMDRRKSLGVVNNNIDLGYTGKKSRTGSIEEEVRLPSSRKKHIDIDKYLTMNKPTDNSTENLLKTSNRSRMIAGPVLVRGPKSQSMHNLIKSKHALLSKVPDMSKINEDGEIDIDEKMKNLPHWKYVASFTNYISALTTVNPHVKEEFMKYYESKDYK